MGSRALALVVAAIVVVAALERTVRAEPFRRSIRRQLSAVRACYEAELVRAPRIEGRVVLRLEVDGAGHVASAAVESSTLASPPIERCVRGVARRWQLATDGVAATITYPFAFRPAEPRDQRERLRVEARFCWDLALFLGATEDAHAYITTVSEADGFAAVAVEQTELPPPAAECLARAAWRHFSPGTISIQLRGW